MIKKKLSNGMGQIVINNDILDNLKRALSKKYVTQVGVLGSKAENRMQAGGLAKSKGSYTGGHKKSKTADEMTNAEIGAIHEFGIKNEKSRMPQRSFLKMPLTRSAKELFEKRQTLTKYVNSAIDKGTPVDAAWLKAHQDLGVIAQQIVQKSFKDSGPDWDALKASTIARKKSDKPLIDTGQLRASIMSRVVEK